MIKIHKIINDIWVMTRVVFSSIPKLCKKLTIFEKVISQFGVNTLIMSCGIILLLENNLSKSGITAVNCKSITIPMAIRKKLKNSVWLSFLKKKFSMVV